MDPRKFTQKTLLLTGVLLAGLGLFNWLINPLALFQSPAIKGLNQFKTEFFLSLFVSKPYVVARQQPDALLLGTSRAGASLSSRHPGWQGFNAYNYALPGSTASMQLQSFQHASSAAPIRRVLLSLDLPMLNNCRDPRR